MANSTVKTIKDYYEQMYQKFPDVPKQDIKRIIQYGWKQIYLLNSYGGDTIVRDKNFWCYIGHLKKDSLEYFKYYIKKLALRIRVMYKRKKIPWDGYYYFALNNIQYQDYINSKKKRGRPKKHFIFTNIMLYQILDECKIAQHEKKYIFRIPYLTTIRYQFFIKELKTDKAELIIERNPLKFSDILVSNNEYDVL